jgi:hypothetical protein
VQFRRVARGANEFSYLTPMPAAFTQRAIVHVSQAATLVGLEAPKAALNLELKPYALGGVATDMDASVPFRNDPSAGVGFDTKYAFKNGLVADATVNTDFAQVGMDFQNGDEWRLEFKNNYESLDEPFEMPEGVVLPVGG